MGESEGDADEGAPCASVQRRPSFLLLESHFIDEHCDSSGGSGVIEYCEYWNGTSWPDVYTITNIPNGYYHWSHWEGASWQRRIHVYRVYQTGFFRSHSIFYN